MPPKIALLLCIFLILYFFKVDSKPKSDVSFALWVPLIYLLIIGSRNVSYWLTSGTITAASPDVYLEGNPIDRTIMIIFIVIASVILSRREISWSQIFKSNRWLFVFILYCGISITWSDFPFVSLKRYIKDIGTILIVLVVLTEHDPAEALKTILRRCGYVLIPLSIVLYKYYPHLGRAYHQNSGKLMVTGVATDKNGLGALCLVCGLFLFWVLLKMWRNRNVPIDKKKAFVNVSLLLLTLWLIIAADSATSIMCLIVGSTILIMMEMPYVRRNVKLIAVCGIFTAFIVQFSLDILTSIIDSLGRDITFTGRTELWEELLKMDTNPLIGVGYNSFWLGDRMALFWQKYWWRPTSAHNGFLEIYLNLGITGLFLLTGVIISAFKKIGEELILNLESGGFQMALLVVFLLYNVTESAFRVDFLMYFMFLLIIVKVSPMPQPQNHGRNSYT